MPYTTDYYSSNKNEIEEIKKSINNPYLHKCADTKNIIRDLEHQVKINAIMNLISVALWCIAILMMMYK